MTANPQTAMIMAAGLGTRMRPLTETMPKPMVVVAGKPLIEYALDSVRAAGVDRVIVNVHYLPDQIEAYMAEHVGDLDVVISDERDQLLETGGGLMKIQTHIAGDPFYCINSDAIWTEDDGNVLQQLAAHWDDDAMDALLLLVPKMRAFHHRGKGDFSIDGAGRLIRRGDNDSAPYIFTGIQLISKRLLRGAPDGPFSTNILWNRAIEEGRLFGLEHQGDWYDIGAPDAIAPTEQALAALNKVNV